MRRFIRRAVLVASLFMLVALVMAPMALAQSDETLSVGGLFNKFWNDGKVDVLVLLLGADFIFGVVSAFKRGTFRLSYVADFLRKDVIFKLGGYLILYAAALYAGEVEIIGIPEFDPGLIAGVTYGVVVAAFVGSILNSLRELGLVPGVDPPPEPPADTKPSVLDMATADENI